MGLREYKRKRDFSRTPEPAGSKATKQRRRSPRFVVQKHAATRLHYDFRLEMNGALASWAVPKGPSLDPAEKRLAVEVEDHPLDYGSFEGVIPKGEYGGGPVMVWDYGTWTPHDGDRAAGKLKFTLAGQKLSGAWMLVRMGRQDRGKPNWLLIKERDDAARPSSEGEIVDELPESVLSGRTIEEIAAGKKRPARGKTAATRASTSKAKSSRLNAADLDGARKAAFPRKIDAQLATLIRRPPTGDQWLHEMKFDGYRMLCSIQHGSAKFVSRNNQDWSARMRGLVEPVVRFPAKQAVLDGEVVVFDKRGVSSFQDLQKAFRGETGRPPVYCVFDLLYVDGYDLRRVPLEHRKELLEQMIAKMPASARQRVQYSDHIVGAGDKFFPKACHSGLEGIISKRRDAPYIAGRGPSWVKSKCRQGQEFVIGGYTKPEGSRVGFGALLVGYYRPDGSLVYAGRVGTGFNDRLLRDLLKRLQQLKQPKSPFVEMSRKVRTNDVTWVKPQLVGELEFNNWTDEGLLRQAAFLGLREDKPAREITRERATSTPR